MCSGQILALELCGSPFSQAVGPPASSGSAFLCCYYPSVSMDAPVSSRESDSVHPRDTELSSLLGHVWAAQVAVSFAGWCVSCCPSALFTLAPSLRALPYAEVWTVALSSMSRVQQGPPPARALFFPKGDLRRAGRAGFCSPEDTCHRL